MDIIRLYIRTIQDFENDKKSQKYVKNQFFVGDQSMGRRRKLKNYRRLEEGERGQAVGLRKAGWTYQEIANELDCSDRGVSKIVKKERVTGSVKDLPRSGRPRTTTAREDRGLKIASLQNRRLTAVDHARSLRLSSIKKKVSVSTVKRRLKEVDLNGRVARKKPLLTKTHKRKRLEWGRKYKKWTKSDWEKVLFSDESPFTLFPSSGKLYVRRRVGEEFLDECISPTVKFGGGKIQVWGCFSYCGAGTLYRIEGKMNAEKYRSILKHRMAPHHKELKETKGVDFIFQHDNDPKHTSKKAMNYLANQNYNVLEWPSQSPDLNPIENLWKQVKQAIYYRVDRASSLDNLFEIVKEEWEKIPVANMQKLVHSMPNRCKEVIKKMGGATKY